MRKFASVLNMNRQSFLNEPPFLKKIESLFFNRTHFPKRVKSSLAAALIVSFVSALFLSTTAYAGTDESNGDDSRDNSPIAITVVVPRPEDNAAVQTPAPQPIMNHVYPIHVWESRENNRREIIRVYELRENETSAQIRREPFERDGFRFELAEIVRREIPAHSTADHVEIVEISTQTNDLATIIGLLSPTMEFLREDGYFGVLALDISGIRVESQGTTSSNFTTTRTREFPHLSDADTSLVPRTITENGRTYNLTNVEWRTQGTTPVDYRQVSTTFTAVATYSGVGTRTSTIGYTTTAEYRGQISRIAVGRTEFTAHFIGIPILTPIASQAMNMNQSGENSFSPEVAEANGSDTSMSDTVMGNTAMSDTLTEMTTTIPMPQTSQTLSAPDTLSNTAAIESVTVEQVHVGGIVIEMEQVTPAHPLYTDTTMDVALGIEGAASENASESESDGLPFGLGNIGLALLFIGGMVFAYFAGKKGKAMLTSMKKVSKKVSCLLLVCGIMLGVSQMAYAAELPRYGFGMQGGYSFGVQGGENATHFNTRESWQSSSNQGGTSTGTINTSSNTTSPTIHFNPGHMGGQGQFGANQSTGSAIHFDPRRSNIAARASPVTHFQAGSANVIHNTNFNANPLSYNYGEVIGILTVERLGRTINVIAGATMEAMDFGAGHFSFTGLNYGNTGLIGHNRGRTNGFFDFVRHLREGDILTLNAGGIIRSYSVTMMFTIDASDFSPLMQFSDHRLTLVTCLEYHRTQRRVAVGIAID